MQAFSQQEPAPSLADINRRIQASAGSDPGMVKAHTLLPAASRGSVNIIKQSPAKLC